MPKGGIEMGLENLIKVAVALAIVAAVSGNLPQIISRVGGSQGQLIKQSRSRSWGSPDIFYFRGGDRH
jgi:hypothetical protein